MRKSSLTRNRNNSLIDQNFPRNISFESRNKNEKNELTKNDILTKSESLPITPRVSASEETFVPNAATPTRPPSNPRLWEQNQHRKENPGVNPGFSREYQPNRQLYSRDQNHSNHSTGNRSASNRDIYRGSTSVPSSAAASRCSSPVSSVIYSRSYHSSSSHATVHSPHYSHTNSPYPSNQSTRVSSVANSQSTSKANSRTQSPSGIPTLIPTPHGANFGLLGNTRLNGGLSDSFGSGSIKRTTSHVGSNQNYINRASSHVDPTAVSKAGKVIKPAANSTDIGFLKALPPPLPVLGEERKEGRGSQLNENNKENNKVGLKVASDEMPSKSADERQRLMYLKERMELEARLAKLESMEKMEKDYDRYVFGRSPKGGK